MTVRRWTMRPGLRGKLVTQRMAGTEAGGDDDVHRAVVAPNRHSSEPLGLMCDIIAYIWHHFFQTA